MPDSATCGNTETHMFHKHTKEVEVYCSGRSRCNAWAHSPHTFLEKQELWCEGVCKCGMLSRGPHGPGAHK